MKKVDEIIKVLDHGEIKLVAHMGGDTAIARSARVSHQQQDLAGVDPEKDAKLINFLYANGHNTPSESTVFTFYVKAPIFVFRQWHRHRTQSYNEVSARYTELPAEFYIPEPHLVGSQNVENKQMRDPLTEEEFKALPDIERTCIESMLVTMREQNEKAFFYYKDLLECGMPRELARSVLPVSTYSKMFATMNLHNLFGFLWERMHEHAQYEIRVYANAMLELIEPIVPVAAAAFKTKMIENGRLK